ncbi:Protein SRC2 [Cardamine amara subsp. amara]|uniref:Protein SRC2 n=1 Tax=Cardamine amara subsp. amara TaxID=228776 RepID=A0ABD1A590_CARAN
MASSEPLDLVVTVVSAKHLKNVNWRNGDLKPYVILYLDSDHRLSTRSEDSASIKPVWNERITLPLTRSVNESVLNIEIFHSNSSDLAKTLVGSVRFPLARLVDSDGAMIPELTNSLELVRPSGRPQGKIRLKLAIKERPIPPPQQHLPPPPPRPQSQPQDYYSVPQGNHYYSPTPPPPPAPITAPSPHRDYRDFSPSPSPYPFTDHYYSGFYYPPPPPRSMYDRASNYGMPSGPSAPVDAFSSIDHKPLPLAPPRFSNYGPPPSGPSAPVDTFPVNEYKPQAPLVGSRLSSYGVPSGPSAPVDYSPYDHRQLQKTMGGLNLEEERGTGERSESEFGARPNYNYGREYRREC